MAKPTILIAVRKYVCGTPGCELVGIVRDPDIWPRTCICCDEFQWPIIPCAGCDKPLVMAEERVEEVLYGWKPGIAQFGAGPLKEPRN